MPDFQNDLADGGAPTITSGRGVLKNDHFDAGAKAVAEEEEKFPCIAWGFTAQNTIKTPKKWGPIQKASIAKWWQRVRKEENRKRLFIRDRQRKNIVNSNVISSRAISNVIFPKAAKL